MPRASARRVRRLLIGATLLLGGALVARQLARIHLGPFVVGGLIATTWLVFRMVLGASARPADPPRRKQPGLARLRVVVVVPFYNEDPEYFRRCLGAIAQQTRLPQSVWLIDDCSSRPDCLEIARQFAAGEHGFEVHVARAPTNVGKRHAQAYAIRRDRADVWVTLDSDVVLAPSAIAEGIKPFASPRVTAVAGLTLGHNWKRNWLTRIIDIEFANSFLIGRACASRWGAVTVVCGTMALYRDSVVRENLEDYLSESFLGRPVRAGDDRRLTQYALRVGRVVFQETAVAYTALPERLGHLVRQRLRWSASFYRGVAWVVTNLGFRDVAYWFIVAQVVELVVVAMMLIALLAHSVTAGLAAFAAYTAYVGVLAYVRSIRYLSFSRPDMRMTDKLASVALAPLISLLYVLVLNPLRYWSITKVTDSRWFTREHVEVSLDG